jgi:hypothetical protein
LLSLLTETPTCVSESITLSNESYDMTRITSILPNPLQYQAFFHGFL